MSALRAVRVGDPGKHGVLLEGRDGAGDENTDDRKTDSEPALDVEIAEPFAVPIVGVMTRVQGSIGVLPAAQAPT